MCSLFTFSSAVSDFLLVLQSDLPTLIAALAVAAFAACAEDRSGKAAHRWYHSQEVPEHEVWPQLVSRREAPPLEKTSNQHR